MTVSVVIPWRPGCPHREAARTFVTSWWAANYPNTPIIVGVDDDRGRGPWSKGRALAAGLAQVTTDVVVVSDADVVVPDICHAIAAIEQGGTWAAPFRTVLRLSPFGTQMVYETGHLPAEPVLPNYLERRYAGQPGGGIVVIPTQTARTIPIDPRFVGWGQEDLSWARALNILAGGPWRSPSVLYHLWHPAENRLTPGIGSQAGLELYTRYKRAVHPTLMTPIVNEAIAALSEAP